MTGADFTVVICTRNRPEHLATLLASLDRQTRSDFPLVVVDQSDVPNALIEQRAARDPRLTFILDLDRGLSRARNLGWPRARTEWVALLDDDCTVDPNWAEAVTDAVRSHPEVDLVAGDLSSDGPTEDDQPLVAIHVVLHEQVRSGRWTHPWQIGLAPACIIRRSAIERLGGWDVDLGAGAPIFPAAEDMDFNYRFLKSGGTAVAIPSVMVQHHQWRGQTELGPHLGGYMKGWAGFSMKHLRQGDVTGGIWLWSLGAHDTFRMFASAARRRSSLRLCVAARKLEGLVSGTFRGLVHPW